MLVEEYRELSEISLGELHRLRDLGDAMVIGGWAAHLLANEKFREWKGVDYIGSKDIDFGVREKSLGKTIRQLENSGYKAVNFRFYKIFDRETKKEISEAEGRKCQIFKIFYLYVDLILDSPSKKKTVFFHDEIVKFAFDNRLWINSGGMKVIAPEALLLTKLNILDKRDEEKRLKDILDCIFVAGFSNLNIDLFRELKGRFKVSRANLTSARKLVVSELIDRELYGLRFDQSEIQGIKTAFLSLLE